MKIIETYGNYIEKWSNENPDRARWLLKTGWKAQNLKFRFAPDKRLMPAEQYLARLMMDTMIRPLERPEESAIVSIFTPCEILQEAGLHPYNVEGFSCYLSASKAERAFLQQAENTGISETLCSYHKTFIGAAQKKVLPKPKCIVYTNLTCDANLLTFKKLAKMYDVPIFAICLGHQLMALATGCDTEKMKYGHRGANHPVKDLETGRVYISSQNHGYAVDGTTIDPAIAKEAFINVNDGTNEGLAYEGKNIFTVQFHPEACPGPQDSGYLFDRFMDMMKGAK